MGNPRYQIRAGVLLACFVFFQAAHQGWAQVAHHVEVALPAGVASESVFIRYCVTGTAQRYCDWVSPQKSVGSYSIAVANQEQPARTLNAILYAPGCAVQTLSVSAAQDVKYPFVCRPVPSTKVNGVITQGERLYGRQVKLEAKYVAYWAKEFLGFDDGVVTTIPIGTTGELMSGNHFRLEIPDFSSSPQPSAIQIWAKEKASGDIVALLMPNEYALQRGETRIRVLKTEPGYPNEISFVPCAANRARPATVPLKFAVRPDQVEACR